jgi:hypothetical protein
MPKRRILYILMVTALLSVPFYLLRDDMDTEEIRKNRYWAIKTRNTLSYDIVVGGDSRVFRGISPKHFASELQDRSVFNYAYWANGYGKDYLEGLERKIDTNSDFRMIVLGITPHSLTRKTARSPHYHYELNKSKESVIQTIYFSQLQEFFAPYGIIDLLEKLTGRSKPSNKRITYHPDGWVETYWIVPDTSNAAKSYLNLFNGDPVSDEVIDGLLSTVERWTSNDIHVVGFRPPASYTIRQYEEQLGGFSEADLVERFTAAGGIWIPVEPEAYQSYDGSHLEHRSAMRFSADLARMIREQIPEL